MLLKLIDDMKRALDANCYLAALAIALTLPDICGKAEYSSACNTRRYIDWYNKYVAPFECPPSHEGAEPENMPYLSGEVVYNLRNSFLHQGNPNIDNGKIKQKENKIDKFSLVIQSKNEIDLYSDVSSVQSDCIGRTIRSYRVNVRRLCFILGNTAKGYYKENKEKFDFFQCDIIDWDKEMEKSNITFNRQCDETNEQK